MPHIIVGTAGHIDHGKTALVKALTGIDADRLKEEKERGITIDIGFANLELDSETTIGFIDVPGHERFIKNMLAGIGGIDLVMLVVAADESIMPQTREHFEICSLLRIQHGLAVITKIDLVDSELVDLVEMEVRDFLKGSFLENAHIVRVSSYTGEGIGQLTETLRQLSRRVKAKDPTQIFRLPIDRCFTMHGFGTVVTGTLVSGSVAKDDEVEVLPSCKPARIRGIQVHGRSTKAARAGQRTALNLQGVDVNDIDRGMVLTVPHTFAPTSMFDCHLELLPSAPNPIQSRKRIRFHIGTAELMGYVVLLGQNRLEPGESAFVQLRLEQPTFALPGDRFIIRQYSPMTTIGGGQILDSYPKKHRSMEKAIAERLKVFESGSVEDRLMVLIEDTGVRTLQLPELVGRIGLVPSMVRDTLLDLSKSGRIRVLSENPLTIVSEKAFQGALKQTVDEVRRFHQTNPLVHGISREELKTRTFGDAQNLVFQAALDQLLGARKIAFNHDVIHEYGRQVTLRADEQHMREQLSNQFLASGLQVPGPDELIDRLKIDRNTARKIIQLMVKEGVLVKINDDMIVHRSSVEALIDAVRKLKSKNSKFGVGEFKDLTGISRKYAIPLLEYLDRQKITRRVGDERVIL